MKYPNRSARAAALAAIITGSVVLGACSSSSDGASTPDTTAVSNSAPSAQVLPVTDNPISNDSTVDALTIDSVLVENNVDPATGSAANDHLEVSLTNTGTDALSGFEVFYTFTDPVTGTTESYYVDLGPTFIIEPGATRVAHFDNTGAEDHFAVNEFSIYRDSPNGLDVTVEVSTPGAAIQTATTTKDPGGVEEAD